MHLIINEAYDYYASNNNWYGRVQGDMNLYDHPMLEYVSSIRLYIPNDMAAIASPEYTMPDWFTIMENWFAITSNPNFSDNPYPFRISLTLAKSAGGPLHFKVEGTRRDHSTTSACVNNYESVCFTPGWLLQWRQDNLNYSIPIGKWLTIKVYIKDGDNTN